MSSTTESAQYKKMTETPVSGLILSLAFPTIISMMVTNLYNTADTWFVSRIGTSASGAVSIVFSLMAVYQAIGFMFGHGAGSNISRKLGARQDQEAKVFASTSFFLSIAVSTDPLLRFLGSTETILPYARQYVFWILISGPFLSVSCVLNNILRYEGHASYAMVGLMTGGLLNIAGDPVFMFLVGLGVSGAGLSTALSQVVSFLILLSMFRRRDVVSEFHISKVSRNGLIIGSIIATGMPSLVRQTLNSLTTIILNHQAAPYGDAAIAAMGIVAKVTMFIAAIAIGIGQGFQTVSSFNFGAGKYDRVRQGFRFSFLMGTVILSVVAVFCAIFAGSIISWFRSDPDVVAIGSVALRWESVSCLFMSYSIVAGMLFQSTGTSGRATFLSALRAGILFIPLILILPHFLGITGIEIAQPIADVLSAIISIPITESFLRHMG